MTVTSLPVRDEYTATAGQAVFNYSFLIFTDQELNVYVTPAGQPANDSTDLTTAYTVDPTTIGNPAGGFITLSVGASSGDRVTIVSSIVDERTTDYQNSGDFLPDTVNADFDRVVSITKKQSDKTGRTLLFPESLQNATELTLPNPEAGKYFAWRADELGVDNVGAPGIIIPSEMNGTAIQMIANTSLNVGDYVITTGYYSDGDGGGNAYKIVASGTGTHDGGRFIDLAQHQAQGLFDRERVSIMQFGADRNNVNTINTLWANAMELFSDGLGGRLIVPDGTYAVEPTYRSPGDLEKQLDFPYDNITVELNGNLQVQTHDNRYIILLFGRRKGSTSPTSNPVKNIRLVGPGKLIGDRSTHTVIDTNFGFGLYAGNSHSSSIADITIEDVFGDGFYADATPYGPADGDNNAFTVPTNSVYSNITMRNNYRNNTTVISGEAIRFENCSMIGANGHSPQAGFDCEQDHAIGVVELHCKDISVINCNMEDNAGSGIEIVDTSAGAIDNVLISECTVINNGSSSNGFGGIRVASTDGVGSIKIINNEVLNCFGVGIDVDGVGQGSVNSSKRVKIQGNFVSGTLEGTKEGTTLGHGIGVRNGISLIDVTGNTVELSDRQGIYINGNGDGTTIPATVSNVLVSDNVVYCNSQASDDTYDNILVNLGCQGVNVTGNIVRSVHPAIPTTNEPQYGINLVANQNNAYANDVKNSGKTGSINAPLAAMIADDASRLGVVYGNPGYNNQAVFRSSAQSVSSTGTTTVVIAHGLDTFGLSNATHQPKLISQAAIQMVDEGTVAGNPVVVARAVSIDATNITIKMTVVTAGSPGDEMRISVQFNPPGV